MRSLPLVLLAVMGLFATPACEEGGGPADGGDGADGGEDCPGCWRSSLYPEDWTPGFTDDAGRFLHDFSYAGYHLGEEEPPAEPPGVRVSALDHGADPTGQADSTAALQAALDEASAAGGGVVRLPEGLYRCDGLLRVERSGVVLRGDGAARSRLYFTRAAGMSDEASLTFQGQPTAGPELPLAANAEPRALEVRVQDVAGLAPGDDVELGAIITDGFVAEHGMTGVWQASLGAWRAFFRRTVLAIEGAAPPFTVRLDAPIRYPLKVRDGASLRVVRGLLAEVGVEDLALSNAVDLAAARAADRAHVLRLDQVKDAWIRGVASFASPAGEGGRHLQSGGLLVQRAKRVTVADTRLELAQNRGSGGNGYLFELMQSSEVLVRDCQGIEGRHNFIQNWDFGTSGCVFLRVESRGGVAESDVGAVTGLSEYHHSLAMANLVDGAVSDDGWGAVNRGHESSGAGHTATQCVFWNLQGGLVRSYQHGWGYVIGTREVLAYTDPADDLLGSLGGQADGTEPLDLAEGLERGGGLRPISLHEDQRARRLGLPTP